MKKDVYLLDPDAKVKLNGISHKFKPKSVDSVKNHGFCQSLQFVTWLKNCGFTKVDRLWFMPLI